MGSKLGYQKSPDADPKRYREEYDRIFKRGDNVRNKKEKGKRS